MSARVLPMKQPPAGDIFPANELLRAKGVNLTPSTRSSDQRKPGDIVLGDRRDG